MERKAREAQEAADRKNSELQAIWSEWNAIPDKVEVINARFANITNELRNLDIEAVEANFKSTYRSVLNGAITDPLWHLQLAGLLATAPLRVEVLNEVASELENELAELKTREKMLTKKLGRI